MASQTPKMAMEPTNGAKISSVVNKNNSTAAYLDCLKNHAAGLGGYVVDGCGEFLPAGEKGTPEALKCVVCNCHRNFHRKDTKMGVIHKAQAHTQDQALFHHVPQPVLNVSPISEHRVTIVDDVGRTVWDDAGKNRTPIASTGVKKRFRTKFTLQQKEKMLNFAKNVGWKFSKDDEVAVEELCKEIGVGKQVLKVWMQNNRKTLDKRS